MRSNSTGANIAQATAAADIAFPTTTASRRDVSFFDDLMLVREHIQKGFGNRSDVNPYTDRPTRTSTRDCLRFLILGPHHSNADMSSGASAKLEVAAE